MQNHSIIRVGLVRGYAMPNEQTAEGTEQRTIFGDSIDELVSIETTGRTIRPFKRMLDQIAAEYKLHVSESGLHASVVDPANVTMIEVDLHASAFDSYTVDRETTLGLSSTGFGNVLQHARYGKSTDDPITITADARTMESSVERSIGDNNAIISERASLIDPDSIRQEPDVPDLDFETEVELEPKTFIETVGMLNKDDGIKLGANNDSITFNQESDVNKRNIQIECEPTNVTEWSLYTAGYIHSFKDALNNGYVDSLKLLWSEEFPLIIEFEREDIMSGRLMVAPRIQTGDDL